MEHRHVVPTTLTLTLNGLDTMSELAQWAHPLLFSNNISLHDHRIRFKKIQITSEMLVTRVFVFYVWSLSLFPLQSLRLWGFQARISDRESIMHRSVSTMGRCRCRQQGLLRVQTQSGMNPSSCRYFRSSFNLYGPWPVAVMCKSRRHSSSRYSVLANKIYWLERSLSVLRNAFNLTSRATVCVYGSPL